MLATKVCSKCKTEKPASAFSPRPERPIGLCSCCKVCNSKFRSQRYYERRKEDPVGLWLVNALNWARDRARRKQLLCTLTKEDLTATLGTDKTCAYCGIEFNFRRTIATRRDSPTVDRIVGHLGYTKENIVVCCYRCNALKGDATAQELRRIANVVATLVQERNLKMKADVIIEIRAAEGGADAKQLVREQSMIYARLAARREL